MEGRIDHWIELNGVAGGNAVVCNYLFAMADASLLFNGIEWYNSCNCFW